jgi:hypothetical protein
MITRGLLKITEDATEELQMKLSADLFAGVVKHMGLKEV